MQDYIRKYFWLVGIVVVAICAALAGKSVNHIVEGLFLSDSAKPAKPVQVTKARTPKKTRRSKFGDPLAKRNIFCAECQPVEPSAVAANPGDPNSVPFTALPLELVATNVSRNPDDSFATIRNTTSKSQGAYWVEQSIPEAGKVVAIAGRYVDFENQTSKRRERIALMTTITRKSTPKATPRPTPPRSSRSQKRDELSAMIDEGVKKIDDNNYEIDESLRSKVLSNPMSVARGARIVPSVKNGKPNGFKLYAIRPSSVYAKIGFRNGDTIHAINGYDLTTPDKALEVYTKLKDAGNLSVTLTRRGKPVTINYTIR
ncbi:MAG: hypothetical protein MJE77_46840 [Proteobacteria bacterium]|nr:hypothetical protein [Pseudomonadota bacterium]